MEKICCWVHACMPLVGFDETCIPLVDTHVYIDKIHVD